ncbi:alpha/beta fold hydrolase [Salinifilum ghardaiensis]
MIDELSLTTGAGVFDARAAGPHDGRAVLLLHGFPETSLQWSAQLEVLGGAAGCRAVAPDQRGYSPGARPEEVREYRREELVADVFSLADVLGWDRFDLVGHDWGAIVAWASAAARPERVRTLTAVSVPHPDPFAEAMRHDEDQQRRSAYISDFRSAGAERRLLEQGARALRRVYGSVVPSEHVAEYVRRFGEEGALTAALNWYRAMPRDDGAVGPVAVPTLYAWGTEDVAVGPTAALATAEHVTGPYRFEMLQDVSHWVPEEVPDELNRLLLQHLRAHPE